MESTKKFLELVRELNKVAGYKFNTQKSIMFVYTINEQLEAQVFFK